MISGGIKMLNKQVIKKDEKALFALRSLYRSYGYQPYKMSKFEEYDLYVGNKDFLVSDRVITFNDTDGRLLALKPDVTLSIIKNTKSASYDKHKVYYNENVYRVSGSTGQFKEIMQVGLECIGNIDISDVFETVYLASRSLAEISEDYVLDISHMAIVNSLLSEANATSEFKKRAGALIAEKNLHGVKALCEEYGVEAPKASKLCALVGMYGERGEVIAKLSKICDSEESAHALAELKVLDKLLSSRGIGANVRFDFSVVNNMKYYNGIVFSGFLAGICEGVLAGGEYDNLLRSMKHDGRGIGFALYLDLLSELDSKGEDYDVDTLILYDEDTDVGKIAAVKAQLVSEGKSVYSSSEVPEKIRYKEILKLS